MPVKGGYRFRRHMRKSKRAIRKTVAGIETGFFSTSKYPDGTPVSNVAAWQEFGTKNPDGTDRIPSRPFMRRSVPQQKALVRKYMRDHRDPDEPGVSPRDAGRIGELVKGAIQREIKTLKEPPNARVTVEGGWIRLPDGRPFYVKGKKSTNPLIDTGKMFREVTYKTKD